MLGVNTNLVQFQVLDKLSKTSSFLEFYFLHFNIRSCFHIALCKRIIGFQWKILNLRRVLNGAKYQKYCCDFFPLFAFFLVIFFCLALPCKTCNRFMLCIFWTCYDLEGYITCYLACCVKLRV